MLVVVEADDAEDEGSMACALDYCLEYFLNLSCEAYPGNKLVWYSIEIDHGNHNDRNEGKKIGAL